MTQLDTIIRGGTVVDGSGRPRRVTDVGVAAGRVVRIGDLAGLAAREDIDARGLIVAPGVIDPHTHYDARSIGTPIAPIRAGMASPAWSSATAALAFPPATRPTGNATC